MTSRENMNHLQPPSPEEIENLLTHLQPTPSQRFYRRLAAAPWNRPPASLPLRRLGFALVLLSSVLLVGILVSPPLRAFARNLIQYFLPDHQDQMEISLDQVDTQDLYQYASPDNFPYTIDQIVAITGDHVYQPTVLLPGMELIGCRYEPDTETVVILYRGAGYNLFLSQRLIDAGQEFFSIGASAIVEPVSIGEITGEYVSGGWVDRSALPTPGLNTSDDLRIVWDQTVPQHILRWHAYDFAFQLRATGSSSPQKADLIALAQSMR